MVSGTGKEIKIDTELTRAKRVNACLNKAIRVYCKNPTIENLLRVQHWQQLSLRFYGVSNDQVVC